MKTREQSYPSKKKKELIVGCTQHRHRASSKGRFVILVTGARDRRRNKNTRGGSAREKGSPLAFARKRSGRSFMNSPDIPLYPLSYYYYYYYYYCYYYCYYYYRCYYHYDTATSPPLLRHSNGNVGVGYVCSTANRHHHRDTAHPVATRVPRVLTRRSFECYCVRPALPSPEPPNP